MPRTYTRKTEKCDENKVQQAMKEIERGGKCSAMATKYGIPRGILRNRLTKVPAQRAHVTHKKVRVDGICFG